MDARTQLFFSKKVYSLNDSEKLFVTAVKENIDHHISHCDFYARFLERERFSSAQLKSAADCVNIPIIPAAFFKYHEVISIAKKEVSIHATSSGTQGQRSQVYLDDDTVRLGTRMVINCFAHHRLISPLPTYYIMLGYEPSEGNDLGAVKTAIGVTRFAPAVSRTFVLKKTADGYVPDWFGVLRALELCQRLHLPVRFVGFPAFLHRLIIMLRKEGLSFRFPQASRVLLGGGWKQFFNEAIDKTTLYAMTEKTLGILPEHCRDFYSAVEHSIAYAECKNHHMHVPIWSRVIIRDVKTLEPIGFDKEGFLSFVTPLYKSIPLVSVMMGDLAVMREKCDCGIKSPYFEITGRMGINKMRSCAIAADELIR